MASSKLRLKLVIDSKTNRVIFGEANKDFVDFLFTLLACPIGHVTQLLEGKEMAGSMGSIYKSLKDLPDDYMQSNTDKNIYLKPNMPIPLTSLLENVSSATPQYYACKVHHFLKLFLIHFHYTEVKGTPCSLCKRNMNTEVLFSLVPKGVQRSSAIVKWYVCNADHISKHSKIIFYYTDVKGTPCPHCERNMEKEVLFRKMTKREGFVKDLVSYMVTDNLEVKPMSAMSSITLLNKSHASDVGALVEKVVEVGMDEALALLKASLESKTVLTQVFGGTAVKKERS